MKLLDQVSNSSFDLLVEEGGAFDYQHGMGEGWYLILNPQGMVRLRFVMGWKSGAL